MKKNNTRFKSLDGVAVSLKVESIYQDSDGIWVELAKGWGVEECISFRGESCIDVIERFKLVKPYKST